VQIAPDRFIDTAAVHLDSPWRSLGNPDLAQRRTIVVHGRLAMRELRLDAVRERRHGLQVMTFEQLAARLAGGFSRLIDGSVQRMGV
jgi:hypothetical protein